MTRIHRIFVIALAIYASTGFAAAGGPPFPFGDYGDAPDCPNVWKGFPTRYDTDHGRFGWPGVHHQFVFEDSFRLVSQEQGAEDPFDPDGGPNLGPCPAGPPGADAFDDGVRFMDATPYFQPFVTTPQAVWWAAVVVTIAPGAPSGPRYLNVVSDVDGDGRWKNNLFATEWVVRNARVEVPPGSSETMRVTVGVHPFGKGPVWTRFTLSREPIPLNTVSVDAGWDGSGAFQYGETEDYLVDAGAPLDPTAGAPTYNLDIALPPLCRYFFGTNCEPDTAGNLSPLDAVLHGNPHEIHFRVRARSHPSNPPGACFVNWDHQAISPFNNPPIGGSLDESIPAADIGFAEDELGTPWDEPPDGSGAPNPTQLGNVGFAPSEFHIIYPLTSLEDGPFRFASRRIQNDFSFFCCGDWQVMKQESCAAAFVHFGDIEDQNLEFPFGGGIFDDPLSEFGFDVSSPQTSGDVFVRRLLSDNQGPDDVPYLTGQYLHKMWLLSGNVDPLPGEDTPPDTTRFTRYRFRYSELDLANAAILPAQESQLVVGRLDAANLGMRTWTLDVGSSVTIDPVLNVVRVDNPKSFGQWAIGVPAAFNPDTPGAIGPTLRVSKAAGGTIRLSWAASCANETVNYGVYQGLIGNWTSHIAVDCDDSNGDFQETITPLAGNRYYLLVPMSKDVEGSYGTRSNLLERPRGVSTCRAVQMPGVCPGAAMELRSKPGVLISENPKESCP